MRHILIALLLAGPAMAAKPPPLGADDAPASPAPAPRTTQPSQRASATGSGFLVAEGRVLTNAHVVQGCNRITARNAAGQVTNTRLEAADPRRDLALLAVPQGFGPALPFREGPPVKRGESIITYGFPLSGLLSSGPTLTTGDISALSGLRDTPMHFQISAPVQPGNSGGPLIDAQGNVVGIVTSKLNAARIAQMTGGDIPQNVNFAVKSTEAVAFLRDNNVRPHMVQSTGPDRRAADIGELANPATVFLQCYR